MRISAASIWTPSTWVSAVPRQPRFPQREGPQPSGAGGGLHRCRWLGLDQARPRDRRAAQLGRSSCRAGHRSRALEAGPERPGLHRRRQRPPRGQRRYAARDRLLGRIGAVRRGSKSSLTSRQLGEGSNTCLTSVQPSEGSLREAAGHADSRAGAGRVRSLDLARLTRGLGSGRLLRY